MEVSAPQAAEGRLSANEVAIVGGGCFWCTEAIFLEAAGVLSVTPGYAGVSTENPTYKQVVAGKTGHAEVLHHACLDSSAASSDRACIRRLTWTISDGYYPTGDSSRV